jgi:hypothetical protein
MTTRRIALTAWITVSSLALAGGAAAQPADALFRGFEPTGDWQLVVQGQEVPKARIYDATRAQALLVITSEFASPVLIDRAGRTVATLDLMKVAERPTAPSTCWPTRCSSPRARSRWRRPRVDSASAARRRRCGRCRGRSARNAAPTCSPPTPATAGAPGASHPMPRPCAPCATSRARCRQDRLHRPVRPQPHLHRQAGGRRRGLAALTGARATPAWCPNAPAST